MSEAPVGLGNWIPDANRYKLPTPPEWFLKRLFDFDAALVLIPSHIKVKGESPAYLLCRRRVRSAGLGDVAMLDNKHPDTNMCYRHGVVPIAPLRFNNGATTFTQTGCDALLKELRARDTWAITGGDLSKGDALVDAMEYEEQRTEDKKRRTLWDDFYHRGRDAWRSMQARIGTRNKRASDYHGVARIAPQPRQAQRVTLTDAP